MNRLSTLILIGFAGLLASCGSSVTSGTQPGSKEVFTMVVSPLQFTLNSGDWSTITATVDLSTDNSAPKPVTPQPAIKFFSSDPRVSISPGGEVCAGQWDNRFLTCSPTPTLPTGYVTITAFNASHNVSGTTLVSVHQRAVKITLSAPVFTGTVTVSPLGGQQVTNIPVGQYPSATGCVSQNNFASVNGLPVGNNQVQYVATALDANGNPISNVFANDYTWTTDNSNVAQVSSFGFVAARNPGVTNVYATLNGTKSVPLAFVTCPPSSIVLSTSAFSNGPPAAPFSTSDLDALNNGALNKGDRKYVTATLTDANGLPLVTSPLTDITSDPLTGSFSPALPLTSKLTANTSGRFTMMAACEPANCNSAVADFVSPAGAATGQSVGFGFPIYSNVIGVTVQGITGSTVLVTNSDQVANALHRLLVYDSESLGLTHTVELANLPNSLVVAPNGAKAYLGSSAGLTVVDLTTYQSTLQAFPVAGGKSTDVVTGKVLGVSPDSRYVLLSDVANGFVFLIDTTGTLVATRYTIPNITSVTFAADGSNFWIGGAAGVYVFQADTFVPTLHNASTQVTSLAWTPDGQSYFASGDQLVNYSTCQDQNPQSSAGNPTSTVVGGLSTTALSGVPHLLGLNGSTWFDYSVTTSAQIGEVLTPKAEGNVCLSKVVVNPPVTLTTAAPLPCAATQVSFSPTLEQEFITGVDPSCAPQSVIHGYDVVAQKEITLTSTNSVPLSGGVLNDGRKLYFGSFDSANGARLHRIDLSTGTEDDLVFVSLVPSFVAVVPK
jgi:hypothetical protein